MKKFMLACVLTFGFVGTTSAQDRRQIYPPTYNPYTGGVNSGLSVYRNGTYSVDTFGGSHHYNYGYRPAYTNRRRYYSNSYYGNYPWWVADPSLTPYSAVYWGY